MKDLTGQRFGRLLVLKESEITGKQKRWLCQCDCGKQTNPLQFTLLGGKSQSCGCIAAEKSRTRWQAATDEDRKKQSEKSKTHGMSKHPAYASYTGIKQRCGNPKNKFFQSYGGRGIALCDEWSTFDAFWADMGSTWFPGAQIGRIDNDGNYTPANCRWETPTQQQNNKSNSRIVLTPSGEMTVSQAAHAYGLSVACVYHRALRGYGPDELVKKSQRATTKE